MPKAPARSGGRTPSAFSKSVHVPQSKYSKNRLLKTMPAGSQCDHSTVNRRRDTRLAMLKSSPPLPAAAIKRGWSNPVKWPVRIGGLVGKNHDGRACARPSRSQRCYPLLGTRIKSAGGTVPVAARHLGDLTLVTSRVQQNQTRVI